MSATVDGDNAVSATVDRDKVESASIYGDNGGSQTGRVITTTHYITLNHCEKLATYLP